MWIGDKVYFLSDRNGPFTLFAYDIGDQAVTQVVKNERAGHQSRRRPDPDAIVYEQFGAINLYDLKSGKSQKVNITLNGDLPACARGTREVGNRITNVGLSPTGARAVFEARGEILTVPAEKGDARNLTNSPGVGRPRPGLVARRQVDRLLLDESGEYALHLRDAERASARSRRSASATRRPTSTRRIWSPDSKKIAYTDKRLNLWYVDLDKGTPVKVDTNTYDNPWRVMDPAWSPDSKWIAYTKQLKNHLCAVFVYSLETAKSTQVTDGMSDARFAAFDKNGKYLYFTASTDAGPTTGWLDMSSFPHQVTRSVYVVVLNKGDAVAARARKRRRED